MDCRLDGGLVGGDASRGSVFVADGQGGLPRAFQCCILNLGIKHRGRPSDLQHQAVRVLLRRATGFGTVWFVLRRSLAGDLAGKSSVGRTGMPRVERGLGWTSP